MKTEDIILRRVVAASCREPDIEFKGLFSKGLDWEYLLEQSKKEGVASFLYYHLDRLCEAEHVPVNIFEELKNIYYSSSLNNIRLGEELKNVVHFLDKENIPVILLKGIFLAEIVYKNISLRSSADIDLLIKKEDLARTDMVLNLLGYCSPPYYHDFLVKKETTSINSLIYNRVDGGGLIHLHWHLINSSWPLEDLVKKIDMGRIWAHAEFVQLHECRIKALSATHLLLYLAYHGLQHYYDRLILVADILEVLKVYEKELDQKTYAREAEILGLSFVLDSSLSCMRARLNFSASNLYRTSYYNLCLRNKNFFRKISALLRTFFPSKYAIAHSLNMPCSQVRVRHYFYRLTHYFC